LAWRRAEQRQVAEAASAGRSRAQKRVMWSFDADTSTWTSGWNVSAQTFESCAWESIARGEICGAGAESAVYDAGEVAAPDDDGAVGCFGGVPAVGEEKSQWGIAPSETPETRIRCTGHHARAVEGKVSTTRPALALKRGRQDVQLLFCATSIERILKTRTIWSRDSFASRFPCGPHASASIVFSRAASCQHICPVPLERVRYVRWQRHGRGSSSGIPELDQISLAARHKEAHFWVPLDAFDVTSAAGKDALLSTLSERLDPNSRVITGRGKSCVIW